MPKRTTIKLQTNVPLIGTVSKAYYNYSEKAQTEGWDPQLKLCGSWIEEDTLGPLFDADVYLPLRLVESMENKGFLKVETGPDHDLYHVMMPNTRIKLVKEEEGTKKFIRFFLMDGETQSPGQHGAEAPEAAPRATKPAQERKDTLKDVVGAVTRFHLGCMALSAHNHVLLYTAPTETLDMNAVHAGGFTIMKKLEEQGVVSFTEKQLVSIRDKLADASYEARKMTDPQDFPEIEP